MKATKIISIILVLCLTFSTIIFAEVEPTTVTAVLTADNTTVKEGGTATLTLSLSGITTVTGGSIILDASEEGVCTFPNDPDWAQMTIEMKINDEALVDEMSKTFTVSIKEGSYIKSGTDIPITCNPLIFTINATTIGGTINVYSTLTSVDGITAQLINTDATKSIATIQLGTTITNNIITITPINEARIEDSTYKIEISGDGFITYTSPIFKSADGYTEAVTGFYPGDVDSDNDIDFFDFNLLCTYISKGSSAETYIQGDLNRDKKIDAADVACFVAGYMAGGKL